MRNERRDDGGGRPRSRVLATVTQLSTALSNIPQPVVILRSVRDDAGAIVDFRWTFLNEAADAAIPTAEDLIGTRLLDLVPDHPRDLFDAYVQVVETGEAVSVDNVVFDTWVGEPVDTNPSSTSEPRRWTTAWPCAGPT